MDVLSAYALMSRKHFLSRRWKLRQENVGVIIIGDCVPSLVLGLTQGSTVSSWMLQWNSPGVPMESGREFPLAFATAHQSSEEPAEQVRCRSTMQVMEAAKGVFKSVPSIILYLGTSFVLGCVTVSLRSTCSTGRNWQGYARVTAFVLSEPGGLKPIVPISIIKPAQRDGTFCWNFGWMVWMYGMTLITCFNTGWQLNINWREKKILFGLRTYSSLLLLNDKKKPSEQAQLKILQHHIDCQSGEN